MDGLPVWVKEITEEPIDGDYWGIVDTDYKFVSQGNAYGAVISPPTNGRAIERNVSYRVDDVTIEDVRKLFAEIAADEASAEFMHGITQGPQGICGAMRVYEVAQDIAGRKEDAR